MPRLASPRHVRDHIDGLLASGLPQVCVRAAARGGFDRAPRRARALPFSPFYFTGIFRWIRRRWTGRTVRTVPAGRECMHARVGAPRTRLARAHTYRMLLLPLLPID